MSDGGEDAPEGEGEHTVDRALRGYAHLFPDQLARGVLETEDIEIQGLFETQLPPKRDRRADHAARALLQSESAVVHVEFQTEFDRELDWRIGEYHLREARVSFEEHGVERAPNHLVAPVHSAAVVLRGPNYLRRGLRRIQTSTSESQYTGFEYRILPIYQMTVDELEALGEPFWRAFVPAASDASERRIQQTLVELESTADDRTFTEVSTTMHVIAEEVVGDPGLSSAIYRLVGKETIMQSSVIQEILDEKRKEWLEEGRRDELLALASRVCSEEELRELREIGDPARLRERLAERIDQSNDEQ